MEPTPPPTPGSSSASSSASSSSGFWDWLLRLDLRRSDDRWLGGVAAGLAHRLGVDPVLLRVITVVVSLVGGAGLLLYAAAWLLLPDASGRIEARRVVDGEVSASAVLALGMVALTAVVPRPWSWALDGPVISGGDVLALVVVGLVLAAAVALVPRIVQAARADGTSAPTAWAATGRDGAGRHHGRGARPVARQRVPQRPRLPFGLVSAVLGMALLVGAGAWLLLQRPGLREDLGATWLPTSALQLAGPGALALALAAGAAVLGLALVVAGLAGRRSDGLGFWAVTSAVAALLLVAIPGGAEVRAVGDLDWRPTSVAAAERGFASWAGEATLDLRGVPLGTGDDVVVPLRHGFGEVTVVVPRDADVRVRSQVGIGSVDTGGPEDERWVTRGHRDGFLADATSAVDSASGATGLRPPRLVVDVQNLVGDVTLTRSAG